MIRFFHDFFRDHANHFPELEQAAERLRAGLAEKGVRVRVDDRDQYKPGWPSAAGFTLLKDFYGDRWTIATSAFRGVADLVTARIDALLDPEYRRVGEEARAAERGADRFV